MAATLQVPTIEPASITAGDSATWLRTLANYPATDGWTLNYALVFRKDGTTITPFASTASGGDHLISVASTVTVTWSPGDYSAAAYVTAAGGLRVTVWTGTITILPNPANPVNLGDTRSHAKKVLDAIELTLEGRAGDDILDSMVEGTSIRRLPVEQLILLRDRYRTEYAAELAGEKISKGLGTGRTIFTRFTTPG